MRLIVGLDPGLYTAVVLLDLKGRLLAYTVKRDWGEEGVIEYILGKGRPVLFATDVAKAPAFVEKIAARFHAPLFTPSRDLTKEEKAKLSPLRDPHARDAHAAALKAFHHYENRFRSVEKKATSEERAEEAKEKIVKGKMAFHREPPRPVRNREKTRRKDVPKEKPKVPDKDKVGLLRNIIKTYRERCEKQQAQIEELQKIIKRLRSSVARMNRALKRCRKK